MQPQKLRIFKLRKWIDEKFNGNQSEFAKSIGEPQAVISRFFMDWDNKNSRKIGEKKARAIELAAGMPNKYLDTEILDHPNTLSYTAKTLRKIPIISKVQAGHWMENSNPYEIGDFEGEIETSANVSESSYALKVTGDSMHPTIPEDSIIVVDPLRHPENGQIIVVRQNGDSEATVKRLVIDGGKKYLKPDNDRYPIMEMLEDAHFCGVAVEFHKSLI